ncbi:hypothetical protein [Streptomyces sp. KS 21]|uniref:hypothetical protein n=1 Tax=Streptomyces sp. KS 21 TaxID=2485150 RepID=UPI0010637BC1|nr:hypothetical protein [Streptomyces sp. KS 21]
MRPFARACWLRAPTSPPTTNGCAAVPGSGIRAGRRTYAVRAVLAATDGAERAVVEKALGDVDCPRESAGP